MNFKFGFKFELSLQELALCRLQDEDEFTR